MGAVKRYLMVVGAILAALVGGAIAIKPKPDELRKSVEEAMASYAKAQAASPEPLGELNLPTEIGEVHDYIVAVSYEAKLKDEKIWCVGAYNVTVCNTPDEKQTRK